MYKQASYVACTLITTKIKKNPEKPAENAISCVQVDDGFISHLNMLCLIERVASFCCLTKFLQSLDTLPD